MPFTPLTTYLQNKGFWASFHVEYIEILPLNLYVDKVLKKYPSNKTLLLKAMQSNGLSDEAIQKFAPKLLEP